MTMPVGWIHSSSPRCHSAPSGWPGRRWRPRKASAAGPTGTRSNRPGRRWGVPRTPPRPGRAEDGHKPPRLRDWRHVVRGAVDDQEGSGPRVDPGERRRVAVAFGHLRGRPAQEGHDLVQGGWSRIRRQGPTSPATRRLLVVGRAGMVRGAPGSMSPASVPRDMQVAGCSAGRTIAVHRARQQPAWPQSIAPQPHEHPGCGPGPAIPRHAASLSGTTGVSVGSRRM